MRTARTRWIAIVLGITWAATALAADDDRVPGVVIDHSPASSGAYIGSPSITILPNGDYVASHDFFGPGTKADSTAVFRSTDRGQTWQKLALVQGQYWSSLFTHKGALYLLGTHPGAICIRRSSDGGRTWTEPNDADSGLLVADDRYHCAPTPVVVHAGRLWRGFERHDPRRTGGAGLLAGVISVPVDADLLKAAHWTVGRFVPGEKSWLDRKFASWREGNVVVTRDGRLVNIIRVDGRAYPEKAAVIQISAAGRDATFDPQTGFIDFPGGSKKFTIRFDAQSDLYWSLASYVPPEFARRNIPGSLRNTLAVITSPDLRTWTVRKILFQHFDSAVHGFQYVDWLFDGDDIVAACRTAYDDGLGGAHNFHDANYLTFHRISRFREMCAKQAAVGPARPDEFTVRGHSWSLARFAEGQPAFSNRKYVWGGVPEAFADWRITQVGGGQPAEIRVSAKRDATLYALAASGRVKLDLGGWKSAIDAKCHYTDKGHTSMTVCWRIARAGEEITLPQGGWAGTMLLMPPDAVIDAQPSAAPAADETRAAVERAHQELWRRFISPHGTLYDYTTLDGQVILPTPDDCQECKPNALGWWTPIENGAFFGGLYLDALCNRSQAMSSPAAADEARRLAAGLLKLASPGMRPGFVARGFTADGKGHFPASSSDQTYPWFYGLWRYATSGIPTAKERQQVIDTLERVATGLASEQWKMPCDRPDFGHFGDWTGGFAGTRGTLSGAEPQFDAAVRLLFVLRSLEQLTGKAHWGERYRSALAEATRDAGRTRLQICAGGVQYVAPGEPPRYPESPPIWTSASTQAGLRALLEMERDPAVRAQFQQGLDKNAASAARFIAQFRRYDNENKLAFDIDWRKVNTLWKPQAEIGAAVKVASAEYRLWNAQSPRRVAEADALRDPLFAAWIVALSGNKELIGRARDDIRGALAHYRWERLHTCLFFMAECVYWELQRAQR